MFTCPHCKYKCTDSVDLQGHVATYHQSKPSEELRAIDADHFWIGEHMVDLVQLRYERDSLNAAYTGASWNAGGRDIHGRVSAISMLDYYARDLLNEGGPKLATPDKVRKFLLEANQHGLHTGYVERREAR